MTSQTEVICKSEAGTDDQTLFRAVAARARLTVTVDLPTPPFPEATTTISFTPGMDHRLGRPLAAFCTCSFVFQLPSKPLNTRTMLPRCAPFREWVAPPTILILVNNKQRMAILCSLQPL